MKDKDRAFFEALDTLKAQGINPVAAAHWPDSWLLDVNGFCRVKLSGWRRWFLSHTKQSLEMGAMR